MPAPSALFRTLSSIFLYSLSVGCQSVPRDPMDSVLIAAPSRSEELIQQGDEALAARDHRRALELYDQAITQAVAERRRDNQAEALADYARVHLILDQPNRSAPHLEKAGERALPEFPASWSRYLLARGLYERSTNLPDEALATLEELYQYCLEQNLAERAIEACHEASLTGEAESRVLWAWRGIDLAEAAAEPTWLATLLNNLGWTYDELGSHEEALETFLAARTYQDETGGDLERLLADYAVGHSYRMLSRRGEAREWLKRTFRWAESRYLQLPTARSARWLGMLHWELGELDFSDGSLTTARDHLDQADIYLTESDYATWWPDGQTRLSRRRQRLDGRLNRSILRSGAPPKKAPQQQPSQPAELR